MFVCKRPEPTRLATAPDVAAYGRGARDGPRYAVSLGLIVGAAAFVYALQTEKPELDAPAAD